MKLIISKKPFWQLSDGITQSLLGSFLECRQKAHLSYKKGYSSLQVSNALTFGTLMHECLDRAYNYMADKVKDIQYENLVDNVLKDYKDKFVEDGGIWTPENEENHVLNEGYLKILLPEYFKRYWKEDSKKEWIAIEKEFKVQYQSTVYLRGKYDRISRSNGKLVLYDTKTTSRFEPGAWDGLSFNLQMLFYIYAWWKETGELITEFQMDYIRRPGLRKGAMETLQAFMKRVQTDVDDNYFKRVRIMITEDEFKHWVGYEFKHMMDSVWQWAVHGPTYRNSTACQTRYGTCKFIKKCSMNSDDGLYKRQHVFSELQNGK